MRRAGPILMAMVAAAGCSTTDVATSSTSATTTSPVATTTTTEPAVDCERYLEQLNAEWTWLRHTISESRIMLLTAEMFGGQTDVDLMVDLAIAAPGSIEDLDEVGDPPEGFDRAYELTGRAALALEQTLLEAAAAIGARDGDGVRRAGAELDIAERYVDRAESAATRCQ